MKCIPDYRVYPMCKGCTVRADKHIGGLDNLKVFAIVLARLRFVCILIHAWGPLCHHQLTIHGIEHHGDVGMFASHNRL
jgi:hypothetical protein